MKNEVRYEVVSYNRSLHRAFVMCYEFNNERKDWDKQFSFYYRSSELDVYSMTQNDWHHVIRSGDFNVNKVYDYVWSRYL